MLKGISLAGLGILVFGMLIAQPAQARESPEELLRAYRIWRLTEILDLPEDDLPVFFSKLRKIDESEAKFRKEERELIADMEEILRKGGSDSKLEEKLREYERLRIKHWEELKRLREDALSMLSVKQRCQFIVFEDRMKNEIKRIISDIRRRRMIGRDFEGRR